MIAFASGRSAMNPGLTGIWAPNSGTEIGRFGVSSSGLPSRTHQS